MQEAEEKCASSNQLLKDDEESLKASKEHVAKLEEDLRISTDQVATDLTITVEKVVENYTSFEKFKEELSECVVDSFSQGFDKCHC